jgi:4-hydroxy-tetrahydrodipicolinate reductase
MIDVIICGAAGRMGRANIAFFHESNQVRIVGAIEAEDSKYIGQDSGIVAGIDNIGVSISGNLEAIVQKADVIVEFTNRDTTLAHLQIVDKWEKPIVIGTTGFTAEQMDIIKDHSQRIPILLSPNMSVGVNTLFYLVKRAAELLERDYEVEILEMHHNQKKDAPSGTALQFGRIIAEARGNKLESVAVHGREGLVGERKKSEIGVMALRLGDVVGEHTIIFGGIGERIEFSVKNSSRKTYARGALKAAQYIVGKKNGLHTMAHVLGLK